MMATQKKLDYLASAASATAAGGAVRVVLLPREKGDSSVPANRKALDTLLAAVTASGGKLGYFPSDLLEGDAVAPWKEEVDKAAGSVERVDATRGVEAYLATLDEDAVEDIKKAGQLTARFMKYVLVQDYEDVVNEEKRITHKAFAEAASACASAGREALAKRKVPLDTDDYDIVSGPSIQSGGEYSLEVATPKGDAKAVVCTSAGLSHDIVVLAAGLRYKSLRASCARTLMIDPTPKQKAAYEVVLKTHESLAKALTKGAVIGEVIAALREAMLAEPAVQGSCLFVCFFLSFPV